MADIIINKYSLSYNESGKGDPLVFVHGSTSDFRTWRFQQEEFSKYFHTFTYSRRYHWPNDSIPAHSDYSMTEHVDDLEKLLNELKLSPVHLLGHSYGAFVCLLLAMKKPGLVRTLVLAEPPAITLFVSSNPKPLELLRLFTSRPKTAAAILKFGVTGKIPATKAANRDNMEKANEIFGKAVLGSKFYNNLSAERRKQVKTNAIKAELTGSGFAALAPEEVAKIKCPVLLLNGKQSTDLFHHINDYLEELLPDNERIIIDNASHIMHEDNAPDFNKAVLPFLNKYKLSKKN